MKANVRMAMSQAVRLILSGTMSAAQVKVSDNVNGLVRFCANTIFSWIISLEELAQLYFALPDERLSELQKHLDNIGADFAAWKTFYNDQMRKLNITLDTTAEVICMACNEMVKRGRLFYQLETVINLPIDGKMSAEAQQKMIVIKAAAKEKMSVIKTTFDEKIKMTAYGISFSDAEWNMLMEGTVNIRQLEKLVSVPSMPSGAKSRAFQRMILLADGNFSKLVRVFRLLKPGSKRRREVLAAITLLANEQKIGREELLSAYAAETTWTNLKRLIAREIDNMDWSVRERLLLANKCRHDAHLRQTVLSGLSFSQLSKDIAYNGGIDRATQRAAVAAMCRLVKDTELGNVKARINEIEKVSLCNQFNFENTIISLKKKFNIDNTPKVVMSIQKGGDLLRVPVQGQKSARVPEPVAVCY